MKKTISGLLALVFGCGVAFAGEVVSEKKVKELEKMIEDQGIYVETAKKGVVLSGYVDASYSYNMNGGGTDAGYNGTPGPIRTHQFDVDSNDFNVNQVKLALEKALPDENTWAAGFRIDLMFGEDAKYLADNDWGMGDGQLAVEQAYVQFRVPVGNGLDFKFGKFVTLMGYEVIETPANINVSRSYWYTYGIPLFHTGFLMTYKFNDMFDATLGLVNGWNNSDSNYLDGNDNWGDSFIDGENGDDGPADFAKAITAQIGWHAPGGNADIVNTIIYSFEGETAIGQTRTLERVDGDWDGDNIIENTGVFVWSIWGQWRPKAFNDKLLLAFDGGIGKAFDNHQGDRWTDHSFDIGVDENTDTWWGVALYAKYQITDKVNFALRGEYFHDDDGTARVQDLATDYFDNENWSDNHQGDYNGDAYFVNSTDLWSVTATLGFDLWENMLCRLEYRLDIASSDGGNAIEYGGGIAEAAIAIDGKALEGEDGVEQNIFTNNKGEQHTFILDFSYSF